MLLFENLALYVTPFLLLGLLARRWMQRNAVDLAELREPAFARRRPRQRFLLGSWRSEL